jgi:hypothetical protein
MIQPQPHAWFMVGDGHLHPADAKCKGRIRAVTLHSHIVEDNDYFHEPPSQLLGKSNRFV